MNSDFMKVAMLHKLRFIQRCPYLATEVGAFSADVMSIRGNRLIEYEIKVSWPDFRADFHKPKHQLMADAATRPELGHPWIPHQFNFVVTEALVDRVANHLLKYPAYGLIVVKDTSSIHRLREAPQVLKQAKTLHRHPISTGVYQQFIYRMGSELASTATLKLKQFSASDTDNSIQTGVSENEQETE